MATNQGNGSDDPAGLDDTPEMRRILETVRTSDVARENLRRIAAAALTEEECPSDDAQGDGARGPGDANR